METTKDRRLLDLCRDVSVETDSNKMAELVRRLNEELGKDSEAIEKSSERLPRAS